MSKPEEQIWRAAFDSLVAKKIIEIPDTIHLINLGKEKRTIWHNSK